MKRVAIFLRLLAALLSAGLLFATAHAQDVSAAPLPYQDKTLPPEKRADDLLGRLTLEEKIGLLGGDKDGFSTKAIARLGVPRLIMSDGPQGVRNYGPACAFPSGSALAATWDVSLAKEVGNALGLEARARGVNILLGPAMNICRVAVNGRNFEYFGEDPFLAGKIAANYVQGVQAQGVIATIKHVAANNEEWHRDDVDVEADERTFQEIYLPAFHRCVEEGGAWAAMSAYNRVDGVWCTDSDFLQNQVFRKEWGFKGLVMSDWNAAHALSDLPHGLDLEMPRTKVFNEDAVKGALAAGILKPEEIDGAVRHVLTAMFAMQFFDRPQKRSELPLDSPDSARVALEVARGALVLLKNDHAALPLDRTKLHRIAVYGDFAVDTPVTGTGSGHVNVFHQVTYLQGIQAAAGAGVQVDDVPTAPTDPTAFTIFACAKLPDQSAPGLQFTVDAAATGTEPAATSSSTQPGVDLAWDAAHPPAGCPAGRAAKLTWTGVLIAPEDGDWELLREGGNVSIRIGTPPAQYQGGLAEQWQPGDGVHLKKGEAVPITVVANVMPGHDGKVRVGLRPIGSFDLGPAQKADAVIVCVGRQTGEGHDSFFEEPLLDVKLIEALAAMNPRVIVVNTSGAGLEISPWIDRVPALVHSGFLGEAGGTALGQVLFGDVNPSGRLPMTFDRNLFDNAAMANYPGEPVPGQPPVVHYQEGIFVGYRGYDHTGKTPLFPFGYGLSYSRFDFANLSIERAAEGKRVSVDVTNHGPLAGAEVVEIYVGQPGASVPRPKRELKGFAKVFLQAGETRRIDIDLPRDSFAYWSPSKKAWTVDPGTFVIEAAASERDIRLTKSIQVP